MFSELAASAAGSSRRSAGPDRRRKQHEAEPTVCAARFAETEQSPVRQSRREHAAAERIGDGDEPQPIQQRIDAALHAGVGHVEKIERVGYDSERGERQSREHQNRPGGGQRALKAARRARLWIRAR